MSSEETLDSDTSRVGEPLFEAVREPWLSNPYGEFGVPDGEWLDAVGSPGVRSAFSRKESQSETIVMGWLGGSYNCDFFPGGEPLICTRDVGRVLCSELDGITSREVRVSDPIRGQCYRYGGPFVTALEASIVIVPEPSLWTFFDGGLESDPSLAIGGGGYWTYGLRGIEQREHEVAIGQEFKLIPRTSRKPGFGMLVRASMVGTSDFLAVRCEGPDRRFRGTMHLFSLRARDCILAHGWTNIHLREVGEIVSIDRVPA